MSRSNAAPGPVALLLALLAVPAATRRRFVQGSDVQSRAFLLQRDGIGLSLLNASGISSMDRKPSAAGKSMEAHSNAGGGAAGTAGFEMTCLKTKRTSSHQPKGKVCPEECPYLAQDKMDDRWCSFVCVKDAEACLKYNPRTPIPDKHMGICRAPMVQSCKEYAIDGSDRCKVCDWGYTLYEDGQCYSVAQPFLLVLASVLGVILIFVAVWMLDLFCRRRTNAIMLEKALDYRSRTKPRMSKERGRAVWPLMTNVHTEAPAGAGMILHFNFHIAVIIWALGVGFGWMITAALVDDSLWILGTRRFGTPRDNCILVSWGFEKQHAFFWAKVAFLTAVYMWSLLGSVFFSLYQLRSFKAHDDKNKTMSDFTALISGLPKISGSVKLEETLKESITEKTGATVVGVSVAWDYRGSEEEVDKFLDSEINKRRAGTGSKCPSITEEERQVTADALVASKTGYLRPKILAMERAVFGIEEEDEGPGEMETARKDMAEKVGNFESSEYAFVIFNTQSGRDAAVAKYNKGEPLQMQGCTLGLKAYGSEPDTVQWNNLGERDVTGKFRRLCHGMCIIALAVLFWSVVFYAPYAYSVFTFNYDNGQEPGAIYSISFSMVVVVGNLIMYEVCNQVSDYIGFFSKDTKMVCYMIMFFIACTWNIIVDMVTTYYCSEQIAMQLGFRTYYGQKLMEVKTFTERFETYAMQRVLAENLYMYAFPSTYLIPFILEPVFACFVPLVLGIAIVGTHPELSLRAAEEWVAAIEIDLGRYADIILNMALGIGIFYFPGGYTHWLFMGMAGSHFYIYLLDKYRLLRTVPTLTVASMEVDHWAQLCFAPCCGLIASCAVFKANCAGFGFCMEGAPLVLTCTAAWAVSTTVHVLLIHVVIPKWVKSGEPSEEAEEANGNEETYESVASETPASWFSVNPVHCLRSQLIYEHDPPCLKMIVGKEHLLERNKDIGCFFEDERCDAEDFGELRKSLTDIIAAKLG